jgi:hypothetical protein
MWLPDARHDGIRSSITFSRPALFASDAVPFVHRILSRAYLCASASQTTAPRPARNTRNAIMTSHCITAPPVHRSFDMHDG